MENYVKVPAIQSKLKQSKCRIIYLHSVAGYGKTAAVNYFLRRTKHIFLNGDEISEGEIENNIDLKTGMVVIDDIQRIHEEEIRNEIRELCRYKRKELILIGRGYMPDWLADIALDLGFLECNESDLLFGENEILKLADSMGLTISAQDLQIIVKDTGGYAAGVRLVLLNLESDVDYCDEQIQKKLWNEFYAYLDRVCFDVWDEELREVLLPLGNLESFSIEMAEYITGKPDVGRIINYANSVGGFLKQGLNDEWEMIPQFRWFLQWKCSHVYRSDDYELLYKHVASYYELRGELLKTLRYYELANDRRKILQVLVKNATKHPGVAHFYECRHYYFALNREEILQSSVLICGMSMLYSILFMPEESEEWYAELEAFSKKKYLSQEEKKDAKTRLVYLNIALPHRGTKDIVGIIKDTYVLVTNKKMNLPEFSVTSNLPSIMFGGKDFCEWSLIDNELAAVLKKPIEFILGKSSKGLVNISLAESGYEKGSMSDYELQTRLNTGFLMAESGGKIEMYFAATGVMIRLHMLRGQVDVAKRLLISFREKVRKEQSLQLLDNINALMTWIAAMTGDVAELTKWLALATDENKEFCVMNRFIYLQKVRAYIALSRNAEATGLIEKLHLYFTAYQRHHDYIELLLLKAILLYRMGNEMWKESLEDALKKAEHFHFVRMVAQEGIALKPLLEEFESSEVGSKFMLEVKDETNRMARMYPEYLKMEEKIPDMLTEREKEILKLLCQGISAEEICNRCNITYNSLKFHNRNIYKKLGVKSRYEAERKALLMEL